MISLETAKALKEAGLEWKPKEFDVYFHPNENGYILGNSDIIPYCGIFPELVFAPRLDQLLQEIEKRGYGWFVWRGRSFYGTMLYHDSEDTQKDIPIEFESNADSPEEAAAEALIWILDQENNDRIEADCKRRTQNPGWITGNGGKA